MLEPLDLALRVVILFNLQLPVVKERLNDIDAWENSSVCASPVVLFRLELLGVLGFPDWLEGPSFTFAPEGAVLLRKEVIQPLVPQRLPCYDFIPITTHTLGRQMPDFGCRRLS